MDLLQIVPRLPPAVSGVGDYALLLARELLTSHQVRTRFLSGDPTWRGQEAHVAPFVATVVEEQSVKALLDALKKNASCQALLLHYVPHGYEKRGCPFWLVRALEQWRLRSHVPLIVLFHEVSGTGPIWTSGFWTAGLQTSLARRVARLGDKLCITTEIAAKRVRAMLPSRSKTPLRVQAVFSTMGEPAALPALQDRVRQMIVFGGEGWRRSAYTHHLASLQNVCQQLQIERVVDVGNPINVRPTLAMPFIEAGVLPVEEISTLLRTSAAGFFTYPVPYIGKSTIFAAYCAHGMVSATFSQNDLSGDHGLHPERHFLVADRPHRDGESLAKMAADARDWYRQHCLAVHAREIHADISTGGRQR